MSSLNAFLNPVKVENKEVIISKRFMENGEPVPFIIKPVTQEESNNLIKKYTKKEKKGKDFVEIFDKQGYTTALVTSSVVYPDLKNSELQAAYGVLGEANLLNKMLLLGEFVTLSQEVQAISGLDEDINEDIEEVKND